MKPPFRKIERYTNFVRRQELGKYSYTGDMTTAYYVPEATGPQDYDAVDSYTRLLQLLCKLGLKRVHLNR